MSPRDLNQPLVSVSNYGNIGWERRNDSLWENNLEISVDNNNNSLNQWFWDELLLTPLSCSGIIRYALYKNLTLGSLEYRLKWDTRLAKSWEDTIIYISSVVSQVRRMYPRRGTSVSIMVQKGNFRNSVDMYLLYCHLKKIRLITDSPIQTSTNAKKGNWRQEEAPFRKVSLWSF